MSKLLIVGCASLDTIHIENAGHRKSYQTIGGAALYTALAARMSMPVTLLAPKPEPMPESFKLVAQVIDWQGPVCKAEQLPRLEIVHHGGGKATLLHASWGAESMLAPDSMPDLSEVSIVHIGALSSVQKQLEFLSYCRQHSSASISVGTYARLVYQHKELVEKLFANSDFFFMNANEAVGLFGSSELESFPESPKFCITNGAEGATVYSGKTKFKIAATPANELDPTGAGDTFCGTTLAHILRGMPMEEGAEIACDVAASKVEEVGPAFLLDNLKRFT